MEYQSLEDRRLLAIDIGVNVTSTSFGAAGSPADTTGAVGPNHVVEIVDDVINVFDRTGTLQASKALDTFWTDTGGLGAQSSEEMVAGTGSAKIVYDVDSRRWFITSTSNADIITGTDGVQAPTLVAVSRTSNPLQDWQSLFDVYDTDADGLPDAGLFWRISVGRRASFDHQPVCGREQYLRDGQRFDHKSNLGLQQGGKFGGGRSRGSSTVIHFRH